MPGGFVCSGTMKGALRPDRRADGRRGRAAAAEALLEGAAGVLRGARAGGHRAGRPRRARADLRPEAAVHAGGARPPARRRDVALPGRLARARALDALRHRPRRSRWRPRRARSSAASGVDLSGEQQTKTRKALEYFAKASRNARRVSADARRRSCRAGSGGRSASAFGAADETLGALEPERVQESDEMYLLSRRERRVGEGARRADGRQAARAGERRRARAVAAGDEGGVPARRARTSPRCSRRSASRRAAARARRRTRSTSSSTRSSSRTTACAAVEVHKHREHYRPAAAWRS